MNEIRFGFPLNTRSQHPGKISFIMWKLRNRSVAWLFSICNRHKGGTFSSGRPNLLPSMGSFDICWPLTANGHLCLAPPLLPQQTWRTWRTFTWWRVCRSRSTQRCWTTPRVATHSTRTSSASYFYGSRRWGPSAFRLKSTSTTSIWTEPYPATTCSSRCCTPSVPEQKPIPHLTPPLQSPVSPGSMLNSSLLTTEGYLFPITTGILLWISCWPGSWPDYMNGSNQDAWTTENIMTSLTQKSLFGHCNVNLVSEEQVNQVNCALSKPCDGCTLLFVVFGMREASFVFIWPQV